MDFSELVKAIAKLALYSWSVSGPWDFPCQWTKKLEGTSCELLIYN